MNLRAFNLKMKFGAVVADFITFVALALCTGIAASVVLGGIVLLLTGEPRGADAQTSINAAALQKTPPQAGVVAGEAPLRAVGTNLREAP